MRIFSLSSLQTILNICLHASARCPINFLRHRVVLELVKVLFEIACLPEFCFHPHVTTRQQKPVCSHSVSMPTHPPSVFDNLTSILFRFSFLRGQVVNHCGLCANLLDIADPPQESILVLPFLFCQGFAILLS